MTTPVRAAEADKASVAYQAALVQIGLATIQDAQREWQGVPTNEAGRVAATWLRKATRLILTRRRQARELAYSYYRLARALRTGFTIADPYKAEPQYITLAKLRDEFDKLLRARGVPPIGGSEGGNTRVEVEELPGLLADDERLERYGEYDASQNMPKTGTQNLDRKNDALDTEKPADEVDAARTEAHRKVGNRQAAEAGRIAMNGGRETGHSLASKDKRVVAYARVSRSGTPCGWCAMLISRGAIYKSARSATVDSDGETYHTNCMCVAVPIYSKRDYDSSPQFDLNRKYAAEWPRVTRGLSGKDAVAAWRKYIRQQQREQDSAAPTDNAQEA